MITEKQRDYLDFIYREYRLFIDLAAGRWHHRPEVLAGIIMRESEGGLSGQLVDEYGTIGNLTDDVGDGSHGHGLMQIDDRSYPEYCKGDDWKNPQINIEWGAGILAWKRAYLKKHLLGFGVTDDEIERFSICAYNCGEGTVRKAFEAGEDPDSKTAHGNYAAAVLEFADAYLQLSSSQQSAGYS